VDVYSKRAVASSSAAWIEINREAVVAALKSQGGMEEVVWRPNVELLKLEGIAPPQKTAAEPASVTPEVSPSPKLFAPHPRGPPSSGYLPHSKKGGKGECLHPGVLHDYYRWVLVDCKWQHGLGSETSIVRTPPPLLLMQVLLAEQEIAALPSPDHQ